MVHNRFKWKCTMVHTPDKSIDDWLTRMFTSYLFNEWKFLCYNRHPKAVLVVEPKTSDILKPSFNTELPGCFTNNSGFAPVSMVHEKRPKLVSPTYLSLNCNKIYLWKVVQVIMVALKTKKGTSYILFVNIPDETETGNERKWQKM